MIAIKCCIHGIEITFIVARTVMAKGMELCQITEWGDIASPIC